MANDTATVTQAVNSVTVEQPPQSSITVTETSGGALTLSETTGTLTAVNVSPLSSTLTIESEFAALNSPNFTGTPTAPTASPGTNTTQIATTAFVNSAVSLENSLSEMEDVNFASLGDNELLQYDSSSSKWKNQTIAEIGLATTSSLSAHTSATNNPHSVTATQVNLGNVTNESKATMFSSPTFTGTPLAPTASAATNNTQLATTQYVTTAITNLIDSSPDTLNTLNELAAALNDDANFAGTITTSIATKLPLAGGTLTGVLKLPDGAVGAPALSFANDADSGIYWDNTNKAIRFSIDGVQRGYFSTAGILSQANVYTGNTGQFRNYGGTWKATTGLTGNGFEFSNSVDGTVMTLSSAGVLNVTGNITLGGTVDGRDVAADGSKLDNIEPNATADQTASEIRALVDSASDSNVFTDADHSKLDGIAASANNYAHPSHSAISLTLSTAEVLASLTSDSSGHITGATKRTLTLANLGYTGETDATADQTAAEILTAIKTVDGTGSGLDADTLDGSHASTFAAASDLSTHVAATNPHNITLSGLGGFPLAGGTMTGLVSITGGGSSSPVGVNGLHLMFDSSGGTAHINAQHNGTSNRHLSFKAASYSFNSGGVTLDNNLTLSYAYPRINLTDTNNDSDYSIINNDGSFSIYDVTNTSHRFLIAADGNTTFAGNLTVGDGHFIGDDSFDNLTLISSSGENVVIASANDIYLKTDASGGGTGTNRLVINETGATFDGTVTGTSFHQDDQATSSFYQATFDSDVTVASSLILHQAGNFNYISSQDASKDLIIRNTGSGKDMVLQVTSSGGTAELFRLRGVNSKEIVSSANFEIRNGTSSRHINLYETYTDSSNYERSFFKHASSFLEIGTEALGTGTASGLKLKTAGVDRITVLSGGQVGINTTTVPHVLSVKGTISRLNSSGIQVINLGTTSDHAQLLLNNSGGVNRIAFNTGGADSYINAGKFGIGTTTPSSKLHVLSGAVSGYSEDTYADIIVEDSDARIQVVSDNGGTNGSSIILTNVDSGTHSNWAIGQTTTGNSNKLHIGHNTSSGGDTSNFSNTQDLVITTDGKVGIGTTSPASILDVNGGSANGVKIQAANAATEYVLSATTSNGTSRLWVGGTGNVGIGTTSPASPLSVVGSARIDGSSGDGVLTIANSAGSQSLRLDQNSIRTTTNNNLTFLTNGNSNSLVLNQSTNNIGIGTNVPDHRLEVDLGGVVNNEAVSENQGIKVVNDATTHVGFAGYTLELDNSTADATAFTRLARTAATAYLGLEIGSQSRDGIRFLTHATNDLGSLTERMRITSDGRVGINTTPHTNQQLHIVASSTDTTGLEFSASQIANETRILSYDRGSGGGYRPLRLQSSHLKVEISGTHKFAVTSTGASVTGRLSASEVAVTNIDTNKLVKFNGTLLDDSSITDDGSTVTVGGNLTVQGDISTTGTFTIIDTDVSTTEQLVVTNDGTGPALIVNQTGVQPIVDFKDDGTSVFNILNGGDIVMTGDLRLPDGTVASPSLTFSGHTNTGIYWSNYTTSPQKDQLNFAVDGATKGWVNEAGVFSNANVYVANGHSVRTFQEWQATTGGSGYGFKFRNTADSVDCLVISATGNLTPAGNITMADNGKVIATRKLIARDNNGLLLAEDSAATGIFINDSGNTTIQGTLTMASNGTGNSASSQEIIFYGTNSGGSQIDQATIFSTKYHYNTNAGDLVFKTGNTSGTQSERMRINGVGNVGIGTDFPSSKFHLSTSAISQQGTPVTAITKTIATTSIGAKLSFTNAHNANGNLIGGISMGNTGEEYAGLYAVDGGASAATHLAFFTGTSSGTTEAIRIRSDANVGIGNTSPDAKLHVGPSALVSGYTPSTTTLAVSDTTNGAELILRGQSPRIWFDVTSGGMGEMYLDGAQLNILSGTPTSAGSSRLYIKASGDVGIGTTTPAAKLDIVDSQTLSGSAGRATIQTTATTTATSTQSSGMYAIQNYFNLTGTSGSFQNSAHHQVMTTVSSTGTATNLKNHMSRVHTSGSGQINNVSHYNIHTELSGNGTISKWIGYSVADGIMSSFENAGHTITDTYGLYIGDITHGTQTNTPFGVYQANTDMRNYFGSKVGIGTDNPALDLHVVGQVRVDNNNGVAARQIRSSYFSSGQDLTLTAGSAAAVKLKTGSTVQLTVNNDGKIEQNYISYTDSANYEALQITGESDHIRFTTRSIGSFASNNRNFKFYQNGNLRFEISNAGVSAYSNFYIASGGAFRAYGHDSIISTGGGDYDIKFNLNDQEKVRFKANGNVGIGNTDPTQAKLQVSGGSVLIDAYNATGTHGLFFRSGFVSSNQYNLSITCHNDGDGSPDALDINAYDGIYFNTGAGTRNNRAFINSSGKFCINQTDTSSDYLQVTGANGLYAARFNGSATGGNSYGLRVRAGTNENDISFLAENTSGVDLFRVSGNGNVAIGNVTPTSKLYIYSGAFSSGEGEIRNDARVNRNYKLALGTTTKYIGTVQMNGNGDSSGFHVRIYDGHSKVWREVNVVVQNSGGTNYPKVTVEGGGDDVNINVEFAYVNRSGAAQKTDFYLVPTSNKVYTQLIFVDGFIERDTGHSSTSSTNINLDTAVGIYKAATDDSSRIGIGTVDPDQKLHVKGDALRIEETASVTGRHLDIVPAVSGQPHKFTSTTTGSGYHFENNNGLIASFEEANTNFHQNVDITSGDLFFNSNGKGLHFDGVNNWDFRMRTLDSGSNNVPLIFESQNGSSSSPVERFRINSNGNALFSQNLTVNGTFEVSTLATPNAPTNLSLSVVGETINVTFTASTTSNIDAYLVYSSVDGSDYGLISIIPPDDFGSTMSIIDSAFTVTGTQAYRVYAVKAGKLSSALSGNISYTVSSAEPTNLSVVPMNNAFYIQYDPPSSNSRFVSAYKIFKHEHANQGSLDRTQATEIYSGMNKSYMYPISGSNNTNFHQFWVETTIAT